MKMEEHIQVYLKDDPTLKFVIKGKDKQHWIRLFLSQVDAPRSHPCSSQYAIEHACAPDLSPGIYHVIA